MQYFVSKGYGFLFLNLTGWNMPAPPLFTMFTPLSIRLQAWRHLAVIGRAQNKYGPREKGFRVIRITHNNYLVSLFFVENNIFMYIFYLCAGKIKIFCAVGLDISLIRG